MGNPVKSRSKKRKAEQDAREATPSLRAFIARGTPVA